MDLELEDVAKLLSISEQTLLKLHGQGKVHAYKMNGRLLFDPLEVEESVMRHNIHSDQSTSAKQGVNQFGLYRAIYHGAVFLNISGETKEEVLDHSVQKIAPEMEIDTDMMSELLLDREKLTPTSLNRGIGVPHTRDVYFNEARDSIYVVFPKEPIPYGALDNQPVHTLFFLFASNHKRHLTLLAKIAHLISDKKMADLLKTKPSQHEMLEKVFQWEKSLQQKARPTATP